MKTEIQLIADGIVARDRYERRQSHIDYSCLAAWTGILIGVCVFWGLVIGVGLALLRAR